MRLAGAGVGILTAFFLLADPQFLNRQQSTAVHEDGSAQQRLETWRSSLRLVQDRPFGSGGRGFHLLSPAYIPEIVAGYGGELRAPHNTWVMVATEWGIPGLICFIGFYASAFLMMQRVKSSANPKEHGFYYWRAFAIQLSLIAFLVAGTFSDRLYAEAGYWMVGLAYALCRMQRTQQAEETQGATAPGSAVRAPLQSTWQLADARPR
jgi:O-antigen ligase